MKFSIFKAEKNDISYFPDQKRSTVEYRFALNKFRGSHKFIENRIYKEEFTGKKV